ncbi:TOBE domain-containing protein, partial [Dubosiella newyorkensis]|uniref:TOBE domain-containing protein n=1 Tax=Dubosiella newyorkensis TaxID=1862672 RepID=UPI00272C132F
MLGAEVYLHFDYEGSTMTARVDPRTAARTGDTVKFALDADRIHGIISVIDFIKMMYFCFVL